MQIFNQTTINNNSIVLKKTKKQTSFKAISPQVIKQVKNISSNPANKDLVLKLAGLVGLSSIIAWVKSFKADSQEDLLHKLDVVDTNWTQKGNDIFLDPEKQGQYLDLISRADSAESVLWTKGLLASDVLPAPVKEISQAEKDLFLALETNESYLSNSAKTTIKSIISQVQALAGATEEVKNKALNSIESRLNALVKEADSLQNSEETSAIYSKVANIVKTFALTNLFEATDVALQTLDKPVSLKSEEADTITKEASPPEVEEFHQGSEEEDKPKVTVIGRIDLTPTTKKYFKPTNTEEVKDGDSKEIIINDNNKDFVENIFTKAFKKNSHIRPELYADYIDFIQDIYYSYNEEKGALRKLFLSTLVRENSLKTLNLYKTLASGKMEKIDYISFADLQMFKHINGADLTQEEFDTINSYKNSKIKYYMVKPEDDKVVLTFLEGVSAEERLKIITDMHRIAFNISEQKSFNAQLVDFVEIKDIKDELISKLLIDPEDYDNITSYLGLNLENIQDAVNEGEYDDAKKYIEQELDGYLTKKKLDCLEQILNNEAFKGFADTTHGRMRLLERIIFDSTENMVKTPYEIKKITSKEILKLKKAIEKAKSIDVFNYNAKRSNGTSVYKYAPQIKLGKITIGLNDKAQLHTIY